MVNGITPIGQRNNKADASPTGYVTIVAMCEPDDAVLPDSAAAPILDTTPSFARVQEFPLDQSISRWLYVNS
jgi:hypothetical protein